MDENENLREGNRKKRRSKRVSFSEASSNSYSGKSLFLTAFAVFVMMVFVAVAAFFVNLRGAEKVLVPDVRGKELTTALLELQVKELYPRIQLRYSDSPDDAGTILEQSPNAGAIVKGYSRVSLVVSRGIIIDQVGDYVGQKIDAVQIQLQTLFAGYARPLIVLAEPEYKSDASEAGTIIAQTPPAGTNIATQTTVHIVVSRGNGYETVDVPNFVGSSINEVNQRMSTAKLVFDFISRPVRGNEKPGTVVWQQDLAQEKVRTYTRVDVEFGFPEESNEDIVYGIFRDTLSEYPYPVSVSLTAYPPGQNSYVVASFYHPGGKCSVPFAVPVGTTLVLSCVGTEHKTITVDGGTFE